MATEGGFIDLRSFLEALRRSGDVVEIEAEVDPDLELAEIHRRVIAAGGPALLFRNPRGAAMPVVTNLFGTAARVELAFGRGPRNLLEEVARLPEELLPPRWSSLWQRRGLFRSLARVGFANTRRAPVGEVRQTPPRLTELPALKSWELDGGRFLTLPLVHTRHPETAVPNLGMYRAQVFDDDHTGMHFQIGKGGGFHLAVAEAEGQPLPTQLYLGGPPALILAAIAPLPENVPELLLASLVLGRRLLMAQPTGAHFPLPATAELALIGQVEANHRRPEGPFGDHYGYYSLQHDYPVFRVETLLRRRDAIYPATVVGKPRQEDFFIGDYLQELLQPLFPLAMPGVRDLWSYGETGYHSLAAAVVADRYKREAMVSAFRILGEGQLALTKFLLVTDRPVDLRDFRATLVHILERTDVRTDLYVFANLSMDTLDYSGPAVNEGSKGVLLGLGPVRRQLPRERPATLPAGLDGCAVFCPGCLVVSGPARAAEPGFATQLAGAAELQGWPLVFLVDDAVRAVVSVARFLWTTFTRFEPAADIHGRPPAGLAGPDSSPAVRNHTSFAEPVVIDARTKPGFPAELGCDEATARRVDRRWKEYFPGGMVMGDSDAAHLD